MKTKNLRRALRRKKERGNVLAYTVMSALFLFFAVGLGVDLSHFYLAKTELQNAADAAALAGASALTPHDAASITTAVNRAIDTMNLNKYNFNNKNFADTMDTTTQRSLVTFAINLDSTWYTEAQATASAGIYSKVRFVKVFTPSVGVSVFFASPILGASQNLSANATAGLSVPGNVRFCMAPLSAVAPDPGQSFPAWAQGSCPTAGIQPWASERVFMPLSSHSSMFPDAGASDGKRTLGFGPLLTTETGHSNGSSKPTPVPDLNPIHPSTVS